MGQRTPLYEKHVALGARIVDFAGWDMPVQYGKGIIEEHTACRKSAAIFDICHMGEIFVTGPDVRKALNGIMSNNLEKCPDMAARYGLLLTDEAKIIDDLITFVFNSQKAMVVTNAANTASDYERISSLLPTGYSAEDKSTKTAKIDLQGPASKAIMQQLISDNLDALKYFRFIETKFGGYDLILSRTGYTGEYGYELFIDADGAGELWDALVAAGVEPGGLGARDTLRLEAGLPLYGHEMNDSTTPVEMDFMKFVALDKEADFPGKSILAGAAEPQDILVGIELLDRGVPREGYEIRKEGEPVGRVTSGTMAPSLGKGVAFAYVRKDLSAAGTKLQVAVRKKEIDCVITEPPFYKDGSVRG